MWPRYKDLNEFYGNPDGDCDGMPSPKWEADNLTSIVPPYPMYWSWSMQPVKSIKIHKKCAGSLFDILTEISNEVPKEIRVKSQINRCGGAYNFRRMRGLHTLSTHSWGCAIDLSPELNWLGRVYDSKLNMMPMKVVEIFQSHGWVWGGKWSRPDAMHFQACMV